MIALGRPAILALALCGSLQAQKFYTYVGDIGPSHVLIAWGRTEGAGNTIGRDSRSWGVATVKVGDKEVSAPKQNWAVVSELVPDTAYNYSVTLAGKQIGQGQIRTWPVKSTRLRFLVIGDYGDASSAQRRLAEVMLKEQLKYVGSDNPVRFVLTTGDNIYGIPLINRSTGNRDLDWRDKFFEPYEKLIAAVPFYPTLGNHDGNESESRADLPVYLDNFFFPANRPARYYSFSYGGSFAEFYALDSTLNTENGPPLPAYGPDSPQFKWLSKSIKESKAQWKIPYFHHPIFGGGPRHEPSLGALTHFVELFSQAGVKAVFNGHEHNLQISAKNAKTRNIRFFVSGSGGQIRRGNILRDMEANSIEGWAPQYQFLSVEIDGRGMTVLPIGFEPIQVFDKNGKPMDMPVKVD